MVVALLAAGMLSRVWNVGIYPPIGGISVFLWMLALAVLLSTACLAARYFYYERISSLFQELAYVLPILAVSSVLTLWAAVVYLATDTLALTRLLTFALGIGLIGLVWFAIDSGFRAKLVLGILVLSATVSALYGPMVTMFGDPFLTLWVIFGKANLNTIQDVVAGGRMAGLSENIIAFSYLLAAAVPLAFASLLAGVRLCTRQRTWSMWAALYVALVLMLTVLLLNATRSAILGGIGGCLVAGAMVLFWRPGLWKRTAVVLGLLAVWLLAMFVPGVRAADATLASGSAPEQGNLEGRLEDSWPGRLLIRISQPGWPSREDSPYEVELREKIATARELWTESRADFALNRRIVSLDDTSARARVPMVLTALRYSLDHPLGTGRYSPEARHLPSGLEPRVAEEVLKTTPHNQFLVVLVYYGFPGLALLAAFYLLIGWSILATTRRSLRSRDTEIMLLTAAVTGSLVGYGLNSLFHNAGPFVGDWFHFIVVGLVFSIERLSVERESASVES